MNLSYFALLGIFALNDVNGYSAHRYPRLAIIKNANSGPQELVIPARYKIKAKPNNDPTIGQNIHTDGFPEVEYPTSIVESSKPFYVNVSPFSNDVKSSFKSLTSGGPTKTTPTIVVNLKRNDNQKENVKAKSVSQTSDGNEATIAKGNYDNSKVQSTKETVNKETSVLDCKDDIPQVESSQQSSLSPDKESEDEMDYVLDIIEEIDDFISSLTTIETEIIDTSNSSAKIFHSPKEFVTITSDVTLANNDSVTELNEGSLHTEPNPLLDNSKDTTSMGSSLTNEDVTETSLSKEMQGDSGGIGKLANDNNSTCDNNSSCMEQ